MRLWIVVTAVLSLTVLGAIPAATVSQAMPVGISGSQDGDSLIVLSRVSSAAHHHCRHVRNRHQRHKCEQDYDHAHM
jgi:hypothetical protein